MEGWDSRRESYRPDLFVRLIDHSPTLGNFYAQDGKGTFAYNIVADTVAVPNGMVPIPAAAWLLGSGLLGLVAIRRRMKK